MRAYVLTSNYDPHSKLIWKAYPGTVTDCIRENAGKVTFQIQWEVDDSLYSMTFLSYEDKLHHYSLLATFLCDEVKKTTFKMKPYTGGKSGTGTYQQIINHIPPHLVYVAPCAGHDGIFRKIKRAPVSILNDIDPVITETWLKYPLPGCDVLKNFMQGNLFEKPKNPIVIIRNNDYKTIVQRFKNNRDAFIYLDPPYPIYLRRSQKRLYTFDWDGDDEHLKLLSLCSDAICSVMISSYPNELYNKHLKGWHTHEFYSTVRAGKNRRAKEIIYMNYPPPAILHDYQYLGSNRRKRLQIKRQVDRWNNRLNGMEPTRRTAIISSIINNYLTEAKKIIEL